jgi:hypothetical protein
MKITTTQLRNIIKTEVKSYVGLGGQAVNAAGRPIRKTSAEGTVGWLISQLRKVPADMPVMFGDDDAFQVAGVIEIKHLDDGIEVEDGEGLDVVCIMSQ